MKKVKSEVEKVERKGGEVEVMDRELWWSLARRYMADGKNPAIQRWAWERAAPFINPRCAPVEVEKVGANEFVVRVEDYRRKGEVVDVVGHVVVEGEVIDVVKKLL